TKAKAAIDGAKNESEVDKALTTGTTSIKDQYQPGTTTPGDTLETKKAKAKAEIDEVAKATKAKISKDDKLSDTEKATQTKAVEAEATKAKAAIDGAKNESEVDKALTTGTTSIKDQYQPGTTTPGDTLATKKDKAKAEIDEIAKATKNEIGQDKTLSTKEKENQIEAVDAEAKKVKIAIDNAKTEAEIKEAIESGTKVIKAQHKPGKVTPPVVKPKPDTGGHNGGANIGGNADTGVKPTIKPGTGSVSGGVGSKITPVVSGKTLPQTGSDVKTGFFTSLLGLGITGLAVLGFRKKY
ncbi:DUF1542 domain-containing protein, partial [Vagococcus silagei]